MGENASRSVRGRVVLGVIGLSAALGLYLWRFDSWARSTFSPPAGPNVVLIVLDTTRADYFSCYGFPKRTTPRMDQLAAEGARYASAYATDFWTLPSHATILTGLYPTAAGATSTTGHLPASVTTLAERFRDAGYATGGVVCNGWLSIERGFGQGFADYVEMWRKENSLKLLAGVEDVGYPSAERVASWIDEQAPGEAPLFLFYNINLAHLPYRPAPRLRTRFLAAGRPPERVRELMKIKDEWDYIVGALQLDSSDLETMRELYAGSIAELDECVGEVIDALRRNGILDETLVVITSDHGENLGDHDMLGHVLSMYDTTLHVPLIMRYPARFAAGTVVDDLTSLVDLAPTILEVCGLADGEDGSLTRGISLCSSQRSPRMLVFAEDELHAKTPGELARFYPDTDPWSLSYPFRSVRTDRYRLVWYHGGETALYDLWVDRREAEDVTDRAREVHDELLGELSDWAESLKSPADAVAFQSKDAETIKQLQALGYIGAGTVPSTTTSGEEPARTNQ